MAQYLKSFWGGKGSLALPENQFIKSRGVCERAVDTFFLKDSISSYLAETQPPSLTKFPKTKSSVSQVICPLLPGRTKKWGPSQTRCRFEATSSPHTYWLNVKIQRAGKKEQSDKSRGPGLGAETPLGHGLNLASEALSLG